MSWQGAGNFRARKETNPRRPCAGVVFRGIGEGVERCGISEAFEAGTIIVVNEVLEEGVSLGVGIELVFAFGFVGLRGVAAGRRRCGG